MTMYQHTWPKKAESPPYLIEPTKQGTYIVKRGRYKQSLYGGSVRWTTLQEYGTLSEAVEATL